MRIVLASVAAACVLASAGAAHAEEPTCSALARQKNLTGEACRSFVAACERVGAERETSAKSRKSARPRMSPEEEERLDRAMTRNLLQSIEEELRRKQPGN
jgi:hypothetical protein